MSFLMEYPKNLQLNKKIASAITTPNPRISPVIFPFNTIQKNKNTKNIFLSPAFTSRKEWKSCFRLDFHPFFLYLYQRYMISCLPGPLDTILIGTPSSFSMNSIYLRQFSGSLSYSLIPRISSFQPGRTS